MIASRNDFGVRWAIRVALIATAHSVCAQPAPVPELVNYQGMIYLDSGSSDVNGEFDLRFRLYDGPKDGNLLWGESLDAVQVVGGQFNVVLGNGAPIDDVPHGALTEAFKHSRVYLEIAVGDEPPIRVRQQFVAAPYAFAAQHAHSAVHGVPAGTVVPFAGGAVPFGWLACDGSAWPKTQYPALYAALCDGDVCIWGENGGEFNVPNLGGRAVAGADSTNAPGTRRGEEKHALTVAELPSHTHGYNDKYWDGTTQGIGADDRDIAEDESGSTARTTQSAGESAGHNEIQPSAVVNFIIKY